MSFNVFTPNSSGHMASSESLENITGNSPPIALTESAVFLKKVNVLRLPELHCNVSALYFRSADCPKEKQYVVNVYAVFSILFRHCRSESCISADAWTVSWRYHRSNVFLFRKSVKQKYSNRLIRSFFKIWRWISRCWEVRKYSFSGNGPVL